GKSDDLKPHLSLSGCQFPLLHLAPNLFLSLFCLYKLSFLSDINIVTPGVTKFRDDGGRTRGNSRGFGKIAGPQADEKLREAALSDCFSHSFFVHE
ncbi:MAG TPA: hypothetical protein PLT21_09980, partial [Syntrophales bacterium]|nr:hypothetical protein [Syntrophales bacterium]HQM91696.1 hypothetical protein [Syntrophales bacterium]